MSFKLYHLIIQVPKEHASFVYFTMESNDGLGFYSTLDHAEGDSDRKIDIKGPIEFKNEVERIISFLQKDFPIKIVLDQEIEDE